MAFFAKCAINNKSSFGSGNGLALSRQQAIIWTNVDQDLGHNELTQWHCEDVDVILNVQLSNTF